MSLLDYEQRFSSLKMNTRNTGGGNGGEKSPHKVAMLLAVLEMIRKGTVTDNCIYFDQVLKDEFTRQFEKIAGPSDRNNPCLPFFHLRSSGFWYHYLKPGKFDSYAQLTTASSVRVIDEYIAYAYLDDELFELVGTEVVRALLESSLQQNLTINDRTQLLGVGKGWDWLECEAVVQDYFAMLNKEISGQAYSKAQHRRDLLPKLNGRSNGSIEFKHQNISAVLLEMGQPYIQGYKPAFNYQKQLKHVVLAYVAAHQSDVEQIIVQAEQTPVRATTVVDWANVFDSELPERLPTIQEPKRKYLAHKTNFTERERNNRQLGERGEAFVLEFERYRLAQAGRDDLAKEVEWSSSQKGDGLGYDIRSFNPARDEELFIEVKTTNSGKYQPFFISENEVAFSKERAKNYSLYRVYDFKQQARLYQLPGTVEQYVNLQPQIYKASFS